MANGTEKKIGISAIFVGVLMFAIGVVLHYVSGHRKWFISEMNGPGEMHELNITEMHQLAVSLAESIHFYQTALFIVVALILIAFGVYLSRSN